MKVLILYYSRTGRTKKVAEFIKEELKGDIEEIVSLKKRNGFFGILLSIFESLFKRLTPVKEIEKDISNYDLVLIGTPIWAGNLSSPIRTFFVKYRDILKNKDIIVFYSYGLKPKKESIDPSRLIKIDLERLGIVLKDIIPVYEKDIENEKFKNKIKNILKGI